MPGIQRVAIIGCGGQPVSGSATGLEIAHLHWRGYRDTCICKLVAAADADQESAREFAAEYGDEVAVYSDHHEMLAEVRPDLVSVCTWPHLHAPLVLDAIKAGARAVHCEKPMAPTWNEAVSLHRTAATAGTQLTVAHQRRFLEPFRLVRQLLREGRIGDLVRMEASCSNLMDCGTHWFDMFFFYNNELPARWVMGQVDHSKPASVFGLTMENQSMSQVYWANGVRGLLFTGDDADIGCENRLVGTHGAIEVHATQPHIRFRGRSDRSWRNVTTWEGIDAAVGYGRAASDLVSCLEVREEPELSSTRALRATELIFATYESSRRRGRIDLPLDTSDPAALSPMEEGDPAAAVNNSPGGVLSSAAGGAAS